MMRFASLPFGPSVAWRNMRSQDAYPRMRSGRKGDTGRVVLEGGHGPPDRDGGYRGDGRWAGLRSSTDRRRAG